MLTHTTYGNNTLKPKSPRTSFKNLTNPNVYKENRRTQNEALDSPKKNLDKHLQKNQNLHMSSWSDHQKIVAKLLPSMP